MVLQRRALLAVGAAAAAGLGAMFLWSGSASEQPRARVAKNPAAVVRARAPRAVSALVTGFTAAAGAHARREILNEVAVRDDAVAVLRMLWDASDDGIARDQLLGSAARLGSAAAAAWLAEVASGDDPLAPRAGAALGTVEGAAAVAELRRITLGRGPSLARANAVRALGRVGSGDDAEALAALVTDPAQPVGVRQEAALALGKVGGARAVPALAAALEAASGDGSPLGMQLRIAIIRALSAIRSAEARAALEAHGRRQLPRTERVVLDATRS